MIGAVIGARYKILSLLGQGAVGQVYLAEHMQLGRKEAIKVLKPDVAVDPQFVSRFRREARATNRVRHPNIVGVYDFGRLPDGRLFLAIEYADGPDLAKVLVDESLLAPARAIAIMKQLAEAIGNAHDHDVVHRDLKPSNLVLTERRGTPDVLKVLDFGLAKILTPEEDGMAVLTLKGQTFGTPAYMAPEQFKESSTDPRVDIYSAGCVMYELITGSLPFTGESITLMYRHQREVAPPPSQIAPYAAIAPELDAWVMCCLEKDPTRRFQTGREMVEALEAIPASSERHEQPTAVVVATVSPAADDFEVDTDVGSGPQEAATAAAHQSEEAETEKLSASSMRASFYVTLLEAAESLTKAGCEPLSAPLAQAQAMRAELRDLAHEVRNVERRLEEADQKTAERETSLRFRLGELEFDHERAGHDERTELELERAELEERLSTLRERSREDLALLQDRGVYLAAREAKLTDKQAVAFAALRALVDAELPPEYESGADPAVESYRKAVLGLAVLLDAEAADVADAADAADAGLMLQPD